MAISRITASGVATDTLTAADLAPNSVDSSELVDGSVDLSHMSANSVDSDQYVDGSIDTAHIADNQITLAKMAGGTDGQIITYDASGDPVAVGPGSDGQVLTSTGAGSPPAFEAAAAGGELRKIGDGTFSSASTFYLDQDLGSYKRHKFFLTIGNDGGTAATSYFKMVVKIGGSFWSWPGGGNSNAYNGSRWWSKQDSTSISCDANSATSSFTFSPTEGAPFLYGSGAGNITAFASYEFTFSNFVVSGNDNWSYLWYNGIGANHDAGNPAFTTKGACCIQNTGTVQDVYIYSDTNRTMKGNWILYGINN